MRLTIGLGALLMLSACGVSIVQPRVEQEISARFTSGAPQSGDRIDANWWARFNDPQLDALLAMARASSPDLRSAAAAVMKARATAGQTEAGLFPDLTGSGRSTVADGDTTPRTTTHSASLDASWEIDLFRAAGQRSDAAKTRVAAEELAFAGAYVSLGAEVADYYVQYRACRQKEAIYRAAAASQRETVAANTALVDSGLSPGQDRALASANLASAKISLESQRADCRILAQTLAVTVGTAQDKVDAVLAKGGTLPSPKGFRVSNLPADVLRQRPDVIESELRFAAAMSEMGAAQADLFPSLSLSGALTLSDPKSWSFGPALSLPIFDAGKRKAGVMGANADAITAAESYRKTVLSSVAEIEGALTRLDAAARNSSNASAAVAGFSSHFASVDDLWKAGGETLLNREEARRNMQSAQITEIDQRANRLRQWIALFKAVGGGWTAAAR